MQVERIEETLLTEADEAAIAALLAAAFGGQNGDGPDGGFGGRSFYQQRHHVRFVVRRGAQVTGHAALGLRAIRHGANLLTVATLGDVATDPAHRGKGIATAVLRAAIVAAQTSPAQAMLLFGTAGLYAANGFRQVRNQMRFVDFKDVQTGDVHDQPARWLMVLPFGGFTWDDAAPVDLVGNCF